MFYIQRRVQQTIFLLVLMILCQPVIAQSWSTEQLAAANTAKHIREASSVEKEIIQYINLCRLYPQQFAVEVAGYQPPASYGDYLKDSPYKRSLIKTLTKQQPLPALQFDAALYQDAACFSEELGSSGRVGHKRVKCAPHNYAECCSFGMKGGKDIAMQWLIDHEVASLGHRNNCLNPAYHKIGVSVHDHTTWKVCAVAEMIW